jgi:hypothetical protein
MNEVFIVYSKVIFLKTELLNKQLLSSKDKNRLSESITDDLRKLTDLLKPLASKKAYEAAKQSNIDILEMGWHDQHKFDKGRLVFHFEHFYPISGIKQKCLQAKNEIEIENILRNNIRVVWLLKEEDKRLTELGYKSKRPNPEKAYSDAGIELLICENNVIE